MIDPIRFKTIDEATLVTALGNGRQHDTTPAEFDAVARERGYIKMSTCSESCGEKFASKSRRIRELESLITDALPSTALATCEPTDDDDIKLALKQIIREWKRYSEERREICNQSAPGESIPDTLRRIIAERDALKSEQDEAITALAGLSSYLGAGLGEESTTIEQYIERVKWATDHNIDAITSWKDQSIKERDGALSHSHVIHGVTFKGNEQTIGMLKSLESQLAIAKIDANKARDESHTCTIDGVMYRGNEETIGKLRPIDRMYRLLVKHWREIVTIVGLTPTEVEDVRVVAAVADLKRQLADANEQIQTLGLMHAQEQAKNKSLQIEVNQLRGELQHPIPEKWRKAIEYVAKRHGCFIVDTPVGKFASIATDSLNGIAAELEKGSSNA